MRPPDTHRVTLAVALATLAALLLGACGLEVAEPAADRDRTRAGVPSGDPADRPTPVPSPTPIPGLQDALDAVAEAFLAADPDGVRPWLADPDSPFGERWTERAANLAEVPVAAYELEHDPTVPDLASSAVRARHGDGVRVVYVRERHVIVGFDEDRPPVHDLYLTVVPADDDPERDWVIAGDGDAQRLGLTSARHLWDEGPVLATEEDPFVVLHHPARADDVPALLREARAGLDEMRDRWALPWSQHVPIIVPDDQDELARLLNVTFELDDFIAFAAANADGELGDYELTGSRVIVNPDSFFRRTTATRQRILAHELLHVATRPHAGPFTPAWVEEGVAQRLGEGPPPGAFALVAAEVARGSVGDVPLDAEFTTGGRERILLSYQLSYSLLTHLVDRFGEEAVAEFYRELGRGSVGEPGRREYHIDRAARTAFGEDLAALRSSWRRALSGG